MRCMGKFYGLSTYHKIANLKVGYMLIFDSLISLPQKLGL